MADKAGKIAFIGCGSMGSGLARAMAKRYQVSICDRNFAHAEALANEIGGSAFKGAAGAVEKADIVILCVKPQDVKSACKELFGKIRDDQVLVSILSGVSVNDLKRYLGDVAIVRIMPNIACFYGTGVVGLVESDDLDEEGKQEFSTIFSTLGYTHWIPEDDVDALTAITGSGPAFALVIIEAITEAGIAMGLSAVDSKKLAAEMFTGTLNALEKSGRHPAELKWQVASPGGCTIAGLKHLEDEALRSGVMNTFLATFERLKMKYS